MEISYSSNIINIKGNIKSIEDFEKIKNILDSLINNYKSITINIPDSIAMTSSVIGYLNKLVLKDDINLKLNVGNESLYELLDDLGVISRFNVRLTK